MTIWKPVKNFTKGRTQPIKGICIHIAEGNAWQVFSTFNNEPKSSHYLVLRNGDIHQYVREEDTAWGSGIKNQPIAKIVLDNISLNPNSYLIQIEHEGLSTEDLTEIQYVNSAKLVNEICQRHRIPKNREYILRHNEIRKDKTCPALVSVEKLINLTYNPPQINQVEELKIKISLLTKIMELLKSLQSFNKLGKAFDDERGL